MKLNKQNAKTYALIYDEKVERYQKAAQELTQYLKEVAGIVLGDAATAEHFISIGVNEKSAPVIKAYGTENFKEDEFRILPKDGNLYLFGGGNDACLYATYELIERALGVKWLNLDGVVVPKKEEVELPTEEIAGKPYFNQRDFLMMQTMNYKKMYTKEQSDAIWDHLRFKKKKWVDFGWTDHNSFRYVSKDKYLESHPEMFCKSPQSGGYELCYTNGMTDDGEIDESVEVSVPKIAAETLYQHVKEQQDADFAMYGRQDDRTAVCQCERCLKAREKYGNEAGVVIVFLNAVVKRVKERLRKEGLKADFGMVTFAYHSTVNPPVVDGKPAHPKAIPGKDLYIRYAPIDADYTFPMTHELQKEKTRKQILGWSALTSNIMVWDYCCNFTEYVWYFPNLWYFKENLELYANGGYEYVFNQGSYSINREWQGEMKAYIASKLYWDMTLDVNALKEEYVRGYYGKAADKVLTLIDKMEKHFAKKVAEGLRLSIIGVFGDYFDSKAYDKDMLVECVELMESALKEAENEEMKIRLARVLLTPLRMLSRNECEYFPKGDTDYAKRFVEIAQLTGLDKLGEETHLYVDITKDGQPLHRIILGQTPTEKEVEAANYLQAQLKAKTGLEFKIDKDDTVYPYFGEKAICVGAGMMFPEFFKGTVDISKYKYFIELCGRCSFIHGAENGDLKQGVDKFVDAVFVTEVEGVKVVKLPYIRQRVEL